MSGADGRLSRRRMMLGGLGAGVAVVAGCGAAPSTPSVTAGPTPTTGMSGPAPPGSAAMLQPVTVEQVHSRARGGNIELIVMRPEGVGGRLPACVALHGRGSGARMFVDLGVPAMLTQAVAAGVRPFAVVAMDGGDSYWVARNPADDPQRMLLEDLPTWLVDRGLADMVSAAFGISMGAYGALNYARYPGLSAVGAISPALFTSWGDAKARNAFADRAHWETTEPLRHLDAIRTVPLGVWCGTDDPFIGPARQLVDNGKPKVAAIGGGAHDGVYWRNILSDVLRFVGDHLG